MAGIRWTDDELAAYLARNRIAAVPAAHVESDAAPKPKRSHARQEVHPQYRIRVHSKRRRLCDFDGLYVKAAIDGMVVGGVLGDDSPEWIPESPICTQETTLGEEETIIELWQII